MKLGQQVSLQWSQRQITILVIGLMLLARGNFFLMDCYIANLRRVVYISSGMDSWADAKLYNDHDGGNMMKTHRVANSHIV